MGKIMSGKQAVRQAQYKTRTFRRYNRMRAVPASLFARRNTPAMALKSVDMSISGNIVSAATAVLSPLAVPLIGSGFMNRLSNRTRGVSLQITGWLAPNGTNDITSQEQIARIMIIYDRQPNAAVPAIGTVLGDTIAAGTTGAPTPLSGINIANRDRFLVLRDRKVLLPQVGVNGAAPPDGAVVVQCANDTGKGSLNYQEFIKLKGLQTGYNTTNGGTIADITTGSFLVLAFCADAVAHAAWQFTAEVRFKFLD